MSVSHQPIIILGAARSGTKMLRDTLAAAQDLNVVEYDVNYVWRVGNEHCPHDELSPELASPKVQNFVRSQLARIAVGSARSSRFVEKTVGNVLRLPFVHQIYPDAKYVFLIRDGRDVTESAVRCWQRPAQLRYLLGKLKTFPWRHGAGYAANYARRFAQRSLGLTPHLSSWGPRYAGIDEHVSSQPLWGVCAHQWIASVEAYERSRSVLSAEQLVEVRYEDIVEDPVREFALLCQALQIKDQAAVLRRAEHTIVRNNIGKRSKFSAEQLFVITELQRHILERWGYQNPSSRTKVA